MKRVHQDVLFGWVAGLYLIVVASEHAQAENSTIGPKGRKSFSKHHIGLFTAYATKETKKRKEAFKIGLEYDYQFLKPASQITTESMAALKPQGS
jgi:hypothetical protein